MVRDATANGLNVRVALGHSFTLVALTNGLHLTLSTQLLWRSRRSAMTDRIGTRKRNIV